MKLSELTVEDRHRQLVLWNQTNVEWPDTAGVYETFELCARDTPGAVAVVCGRRELTYAEVEQAASRLAARLRRQGVERGSYVPVLLPPCAELPVALLGVLKASAAFVPLSDAWPQARIQQIMRDVSPAAVVTRDGRSSTLEAMVPQVGVDDVFCGEPAEPLFIARFMEDPVYVLYTSGSMGKPKGVVVAHRGLANRLRWMTEAFGRESAAVILHTTQHVFDSSVWQLLWPLMSGGRTVVPTQYTARDVGSLVDSVEQHGATMLNFVPSYFDRLLDHLGSNGDAVAKMRTLRTVIVGGEALRAEAALTFKKLLPHVELAHVYGPTEATIGCVMHRVTTDDRDPLPIGRPISNVRVLVLDGDQRLLPAGDVGELCVAGDCLALGYLGDEETTNRAFPRISFAPEWDDVRVYRTGDLVRYRPDGELEFVGRADHQVKMRGYRIELGEVESVLAGHPDVGGAVVSLHEDALGNRNLIGHVAPVPGAAPDTAALRRWLAELLPDYMVPSVVLVHDTLPLTANGKVDRSALGVLSPRSDGRPTGRAARTPVERELAAIWCEVLGASEITAQDDFFEIGGDSLLAMKVAMRIWKQMHREVPLRTLFEQRELAELAAVLEGLPERKAGEIGQAIRG